MGRERDWDDRRRRRSRSRSPPRRRSRSPYERRYRRRSRSRSRSPPSRRDRKRESQRERELKELAKLRETPEERRARRLAKKEAKEKRKREKMGLPESYAKYSNEDNPFNDANLTEKFQWHKKVEAAGEKGISEGELRAAERRRRKDNLAELEKVKRRKEEREQDYLARVEEREMEQRGRTEEQFQHWVDQEETFHLEQAKKRSEIRIREGRAKPIDLLAHYVQSSADDVNVDLREPHVLVEGLGLEDLEDLQEDIRVYMQLEGTVHGTYWSDLMVVCNCQLEEKNRQAVLQDPNAPAAQRRALESGVNPAVKESIHQLLASKTATQLETMKSEIQGQIQSGQVVDLDYWETILKELKGFSAKARLRERHEGILQQKLTAVRKQQMEQANSQPSQSDAAAATEAMDDEDFLGPLSPKPIADGDVDDEVSPGEVVIDAAKDLLELRQARRVVRETVAAKRRQITKQLDTAASAMVEAEKAKGMDEGEELFGIEMTIDAESYSWKDKYRPRKPRFFNRVNTGYEWNKYNQTHYDADNPPPKIVQGYKFNIFYPDLINKRKAPNYTLTPLPEEPGFCMLRVSAGPPYEDIAFKIVNKQWEYGSRSAFKCQFAHNIFQLHFQFKREKYHR